MHKLSFEKIKKVLTKENLLLESSTFSPSLKEGFPIHAIEHIQENDCFIALLGSQTDGHSLIPLALQKGARSIIFESKSRVPSGLLEGNIPWIEVKNSRAAWSVLCSLSYKNPQENLDVYGVTGTDGKTSTVWMSSQLLRGAEKKCLSLGTLGASDGQKHWPLSHTTPDPPVLFKAFSHCVAENIPNVVMEVSSHSLVQEKLYPVHFSGASFTTFSREHLDFHKDMQAYWEAKCSLFTKKLKSQGRVIINERLVSNFPIAEIPSDDIWTYGWLPPKLNKDKHVQILHCRPVPTGQDLRLKTSGKIHEGVIPYFGAFNAENFCAAWIFAEKILSFFPPKDLWQKMSPIPGRNELITTTSNGPRVFVDFAHTPQALETILRNLRETSHNKLWLVFGCGGNRDKGKRPEMAAIAEKYADYIVITSDNPRNENPCMIIDDIRKGLSSNYSPFIEPDRREAIKFAITKSDIHDTILIAGKGHESQQIIGEKSLPFSDQETARYFLSSLYGKKQNV